MNNKNNILTIKDILEAVASVTNKPSNVLRGKSRVASVVSARYLCYKIIKDNLYLADQEISKAFRRDRSAVSYGLWRVEEDLNERPVLRKMLEKANESLGV